MDGKAKNIYFSPGGGGARQWSEGRLGIFYSHIFRPILRKSAVVLS